MLGRRSWSLCELLCKYTFTQPCTFLILTLSLICWPDFLAWPWTCPISTNLACQSELLFGLDLLCSCTGALQLQTLLVGSHSCLPCCESELPAYLPFLCCSLTHTKSLALGPGVCWLIYPTVTIFSNWVWAAEERYWASVLSSWITTFSFTRYFIHILILTDTFISWIVL